MIELATVKGPPKAALVPSELPEHKRQRRLLHAIQTAHPVTYKGQQRFIQDFGVSLAGGGLRFDLYLTGDSNKVDGAEVDLQEQPT